MKGTFVISPDADGKYRFRLLCDDEVLLTSLPYSSQYTCASGVESTRNRAQDPKRFVNTRRSNGKQYFQLKALCGRVLGESPDYDSQDELDLARRKVGALAHDAEVERQIRKRKRTRKSVKQLRGRVGKDDPPRWRYMIYAGALGPTGYGVDETKRASEGYSSRSERDKRWKTWILPNSVSKQPTGTGRSQVFQIMRANIPKGGPWRRFGPPRYSNRQLVDEPQSPSGDVNSKTTNGSGRVNRS